ncbi:hypothetical protein ACTSKR_06525 [Chitinibacteraceae bacterium HSL-7]
MFVKHLKPGDQFAQHLDGKTVHFEVLAIRVAGPRVEVTLKSALGEAHADYAANAIVPTLH